MGQRDERVDAYIADAAVFAQPILRYLRDVVHAACPDCEEDIKWGMPHFLYRGRILCAMAAFRQHATFGFWRGAQIDLGADRAGGAMGQLGRIRSLADLPGKRALAGYIRQAMALQDAEEARAPAKRAAKPRKPSPQVPPDLVAALAKQPPARAFFAGLAPSHQREYIEWIIDAKRAGTREKRLQQTVAWLAEGKRRNWKYEGC